MNMTPDNKAHIDGLSHEELLRKVRFAPPGDEWFQGDTGDYWLRRLKEMRSKPGGDAEHTRALKAIGWDN